MERYVCIHGHFYQPPRENPWLEAIELQDSAYPYHDWNERVTAECYSPNASSRILDGQDYIISIVNNYAKISFNFGPTLLAWLEQKAPDVYQSILLADRESMKNFSGHGSAIAQPYNHMIMPLANSRDKYTQVLWGVRDFQRRFGRKPQGMWLPETAVDLETLDIMASLGIRFTILSPYQAKQVRRIGEREWKDVGGGRIDPRMAYRVDLPSGRAINVFFYDGPISRAVAFEGLLNRGEYLAHRLLDAFSSDDRERPQLVHIATDGESYGHHHRFGDMALAYALHYFETNKLARLTNYSEYLERFPPTHEARIYENTSWSCAHGVERWRSNCGCTTGGRPGWNQEWRKPLREALDWLRDTLAPRYEEMGAKFFKDPWEARNAYIQVILDRSAENVDSFLSQQACRKLDGAGRTTALKLLELQRHAMLMYTSCGWFFNELSGIETVQVMQYAGRAIQLGQELFGDEIEGQFLDLLGRAKSNIPENRDGRLIYEKFVRPAMVDLEKVGAHYAISSLFEEYPEVANIYCFKFQVEDRKSLEAGRAKLVVGRATVSSYITYDSKRLSFGVLHLGDHNLNGGVRQYAGDDAYQAMTQDLIQAFGRVDFPEIIRLMQNHFGASNYSLWSLFRDEQRRILDQILESTLAGATAVYRQLYEHHAPLMHFLAGLDAPMPRAFLMAAEFILNTDLRWAFKQDSLDLGRIKTLLQEARQWRVELDTAGLGYVLAGTIGRLASQFRKEPLELSNLQRLDAAMDVVRAVPFGVDVWGAQNAYYDVMKSVYPRMKAQADQGEETAKEWVSRFVALGDKLKVRVG